MEFGIHQRTLRPNDVKRNCVSLAAMDYANNPVKRCAPKLRVVNLVVRRVMRRARKCPNHSRITIRVACGQVLTVTVKDAVITNGRPWKLSENLPHSRVRTGVLWSAGNLIATAFHLSLGLHRITALRVLRHRSRALDGVPRCGLAECISLNWVSCSHSGCSTERRKSAANLWSY